MEYLDLLFYFLVFAVAYLYSSVGHGGASGYLALMALFAFAPDAMKSSALVMNLFVAGIAFAINYRGGFFRLPLLLPLVATSVPMAFVGALIPIDAIVYKVLLGVFVVVASIRFLFVRADDPKMVSTPKTMYLLFLGALLGLASGVLGIGGGIILSPILLLAGWAKVKETSAVSAAFIVLNSASGLLGLWSSGYRPDGALFVLVPVAVAGALWGAYNSVVFFSSQTVQKILSLVLFLAGIKLSFFP